VRAGRTGIQWSRFCDRKEMPNQAVGRHLGGEIGHAAFPIVIMSRRRSVPQRKRPFDRSTPGSKHAFFGLKTRDLAAIGLLAAAITVSYIPLFSNSFLDYDDPVYITRNIHLQSGLTVESFSWAWTTLEAGNWHPLTWISHALDVDLFGLQPAGHHGISLLLHGVNAVLIFLLLTLVSGERGRSLVVAGIFGLHPLAVESVSWAAERKNVLCTLFFLLAIAAYGWYARRPSVGRYLLVGLAFALGLCAKPMVITLPFVLLLLDFWPLRRVEGFSSPNPVFPVEQRKIKQLVVEKTPLLLLCVASAIITLIAQSSAGAVASTASVPLTERMTNAIWSYFAYIVQAFWPVHLAPFYPEVPASWWQIGLGLAFVVGVSVVAWWQRASRPYLIVGWLFYLGTLVPVIGIVKVGTQAMADRYAYIPMMGIYVALVWLAGDFAVGWNWRTWTRALIPAAILLVLGVLTWRQVRFWHDDITLWSYNLEVTKNNVVAEDNLGIALLQEGKTDEALSHFYTADKLDPDDPISATNVATDLLSKGQLHEAIAKYEAALPRASFVPMLLPNIHSNLGSAFLQVGDVEQAREHYRLALSLNPDDAIARAGLQKIAQLTSTPTESK
jgi:protein O-mannosyl-transferase